MAKMEVLIPFPLPTSLCLFTSPLTLGGANLGGANVRGGAKVRGKGKKRKGNNQQKEKARFQRNKRHYKTHVLSKKC